MNNEPVGVLGAGSFGAVVSNLLAKNRKVFLFTRRESVVEEIIKNRSIRNVPMPENIVPTTDITDITENCRLIFPVVRSANFREMMKNLAPHLQPDHILIHGTKGFDSTARSGNKDFDVLSRDDIKTMSEVIAEESVVRRIGCFSGPNLAGEIARGELAATVIASEFEEVIDEGSNAMQSAMFRVYSSKDIRGVELTGALKNVMAIASGMLNGLGYGENAKALLISRGLAELIAIGGKLGGTPQAFLGVAGIGDLVATCSSPKSRNFSVGSRIAQGEKLSEILAGMNDVVEGIDTVRTAHALVKNYKIEAPITEALYKILFEDMATKEAISYLMELGSKEDVAFLKEL